MWQDRVNKYMILINEPFFDSRCIEELKTVLESTGTLVKVKGKGEENLRPTPCVITSNQPVWIQCPSAKQAILDRTLRYYKDLKVCPFLKQVTKDLHPRWLGILLIRYANTATPDYFSDIDNECMSPGTDTVALVLMSSYKIKPEDTSTNLTNFVANTTSTSLTWAPKKPTKGSTRLHLKQAGSKISLRALSPLKELSEDYLGHSTCLGKETSQNRKKSLRRLLLKSPEQQINHLPHRKRSIENNMEEKQSKKTYQETLTEQETKPEQWEIMKETNPKDNELTKQPQSLSLLEGVNQKLLFP
ncbi:parvo_NS1 domain-containing protein [Nephila pilipes]|uniref:Parvo_NS1 domain-containing protein n=1 Tax=Nephila pilipes TaxID=299642 RepID=A0A8X6U6Y4_NEPPI|nr:parvo_NS1 domain-containing protein [Nephila pilipes]